MSIIKHNGSRIYDRSQSDVEIEEVIIEDTLLHEHEDGTIHSHEGGDVPHNHEENLLDEEVQDNDVSDGSDSGAGSNAGLWAN